MKFKVGDRVRSVDGDDLDGCGGGAYKNEIGVIAEITTITQSCGPYCVVFDSGSSWWCGDKNLELVEAKKEEPDVAKTSVWKVAEAVAGVAERVLYDGPPGTGKTYAAQRFGVKDGQSVWNLTCTEEMPAAELRGHFVPKGDHFEWMDGPALRAMREGGRLVINEIEKASGDVQTLLLAILDDRDSCALTLPTGETVRPHKDYTVAATMNGNADTDLPEALRSRFPVRLRIEEIHPNAIARLPKDLQSAAQATGGGDVEAERRLTIRAWLEFANLRTKIGPDMAAAAVFGARAKDILEAVHLRASR